MRKPIILAILLLLPWLYIACDGDGPTEHDEEVDTSLDYVDFMSCSHATIADSLANILGVGPVSFHQIVTKYDQALTLAFIPWIKEGHQYITPNQEKLTVWTDEDDHPYVVTYLLRRGGSSDDWSYKQEKVDSTFKQIVERTGIVLDGSECLLSLQWSAGPYACWYYLQMSQAFRDTSLTSPYLAADFEGSTGKLNFLSISRWYPDLDHITDLLSDDELKEKVLDYYESCPEVIAFPDDLTIYDYWIIGDILCARIGSAVIDSWGSTLSLFVDMQTGEIIDKDYLYANR